MGYCNVLSIRWRTRCNFFSQYSRPLLILFSLKNFVLKIGKLNNWKRIYIWMLIFWESIYIFILHHSWNFEAFITLNAIISVWNFNPLLIFQELFWNLFLNSMPHWSSNHTNFCLYMNILNCDYMYHWIAKFLLETYARF